MPAATKAPAKKRGAPIPKVEPAPPAAFHAIEQDITTNVVVERNPETRVMIRGMLSGTNVHLLGPPGNAKSLLARALTVRVVGSRYFEKTVHAQMPADALVGGYDMPRFAKTGEFARATDGYLLASDVALIDEITRANGPTQDCLLPTMNTEERLGEHNGGMMKIPLIFLVTTSNFMPDEDDAQAGAFVDRFTLMRYVEYAKLGDSFKEMFRRHHARRQAEKANKPPEATITVEQLRATVDKVNEIEATPEFLDAYAELRGNVRKEGLNVSDRRFMELGRVCRANAYLAGRDTLVPEDLIAIEDGLWRHLDQRAVAHELILKFHGRYEREAAKFRQEAEKPMAAVEQIRPQVEGTPPNEELEQDVLSKAISASRQVDAVKKRVDGMLTEAEKEKRDAASLRELANELLAHQQWFKDNGLPTSLS